MRFCEGEMSGCQGFMGTEGEWEDGRDAPGGSAAGPNQSNLRENSYSCERIRSLQRDTASATAMCPMGGRVGRSSV